MTSSCDHVDAYLDDTLSDLERARFERHVVSCVRCQQAIEAFMQLVAAGAELARRADRPRLDAAGPSAAARRPKLARGRWAVAAGAMASAIAVAAVLLVAGEPPEAALGDQIAQTLLPERTIRERLPYAPLDRHRPYDVPRGARSVEPIPTVLTGKLETHGSTDALVAVLLARGDLPQATRLAGGAGTGDALEIERAMLAKQDPAEALRRLDGVLVRAPRNGVAAWNRALVISDLRLPLAAAEALGQVAALAEPGWSTEATLRATELQRAEAERLAHWQHVKQACEPMSFTALPDRALVRANPQVCRPTFYEAVRVGSPAEVAKLLPVAEELDAAAGNAAAVGLVHRIAALDPGVRARAVVLYKQLIATPQAAAGERQRLLSQLRAMRQSDLVLAALRRPGMSELPGEYAALAQASGDAFYVELAAQRAAEVRVLAEDPLGAEVVLRRAVRDCTSRDVEVRCAYLQIALGTLYATMHRPSDLRATARAGLARSARLGLYWDERQFFNFLAEAARLEGQTALMRAYLREATLRSHSECEQDRYAQESLAMANASQLNFAQARRDLTVAPLCDALPTPDRARVFAELARIDGTSAEADAWRADLQKMRAQPGVRPGEQAYLDAVEGRLIAARDAGAARPLLRR
ncbi:MAG: zf-HC2 domain-containing protein, partial [Kofleriaceae bacterium]